MSELRPSLEYQQQEMLLERLLQPQPTVVAIEGGPCGGKSTLLAEIEAQAAEMERSVIVIPEAIDPYHKALREAGTSIPELAQYNRPAFLHIQAMVLGDTITRIEQKRQELAGTDAIIVADRADIGAYITPEEHGAILKGLGKQIPPIYEYVDHVYYLPSVAQESPEKYKALKNTNPGRFENTEEAQATCRRNLRSVAAHPELHIAWGGDFTAKMNRVAKSILTPDEEKEIKQGVSTAGAVKALEEASKTGDILAVHDIVQSYHVLRGQEFRLRTQKSNGIAHHFLTVKSGDGIVRREVQRRITTTDYELLRQVPRIGNELHKTRAIFLDPWVNNGGQRRLWSADKYHRPDLTVWHFETDVESEQEAQELDLLYAGIRDRIKGGAKDLVFIT